MRRAPRSTRFTAPLTDEERASYVIERVEAMLAGTSHSPDEVVARAMPPARLEATIEKVAVNAVLAGCAPEHLPVLLASLEAFQGRDRTGTVRSTNSFGFMQVVNGPIRQKLAMNSGTGLLGPGNHANVTLMTASRQAPRRTSPAS